LLLATITLMQLAALINLPKFEHQRFLKAFMLAEVEAIMQLRQHLSHASVPSSRQQP
jgi:hypothetical protein